jgi:hypothetical protein
MDIYSRVPAILVTALAIACWQAVFTPAHFGMNEAIPWWHAAMVTLLALTLWSSVLDKVTREYLNLTDAEKKRVGKPTSFGYRFGVFCASLCIAEIIGITIARFFGAIK